MIGTAFYEVPIETLQKVISIRSKRNTFDNFAFNDFTYSI